MAVLIQLALPYWRPADDARAGGWATFVEPSTNPASRRAGFRTGRVVAVEHKHRRIHALSIVRPARVRPELVRAEWVHKVQPQQKAQ